MDGDLQRYLNYHLAGSVGAIQLIQHLVDTMDESEACDYFVQLKTKVENDQALLGKLLASAGMDTSTPIHVAGEVTGRIGLLKLTWDGFEPGSLGLFEGLEMLALGIQGKRLLWLALKEISRWFPEWSDVNFSELEREAISQRDGVERWRIEAARDTLPSGERRLAAQQAIGSTPNQPTRMNSINQNQPEDNLKNLSQGDAITKIRELVEKAGICFFCTTVPTGESGGARPMSVLQTDAQGHLWFLSAADSHKNEELAISPEVKLYFQGSAHSDFLQLDGTATVSADKAKIKELWNPLLKTWFTEGIDDPRITVIKVVPLRGYYWDTKHGNAVAGIKIAIGAMIGKTLDDSVEGKLSV
ncbi:MAG: pyridoxamine 5'-phosphate oxidase family protein [Luteolibacter sp.]|uniref:pyridoxamine 5'-phosphate oxidase family protein n=1 Tax=Luteolibacter sp. TaxID=1962973 RepID=UPI003266F961